MGSSPERFQPFMRRVKEFPVPSGTPPRSRAPRRITRVCRRVARSTTAPGRRVFRAWACGRGGSS